MESNSVSKKSGYTTTEWLTGAALIFLVGIAVCFLGEWMLRQRIAESGLGHLQEQGLLLSDRSQIKNIKLLTRSYPVVFLLGGTSSVSFETSEKLKVSNNFRSDKPYSSYLETIQPISAGESVWTADYGPCGQCLLHDQGSNKYIIEWDDQATSTL